MLEFYSLDFNQTVLMGIKNKRIINPNNQTKDENQYFC